MGGSGNGDAGRGEAQPDAGRGRREGKDARVLVSQPLPGGLDALSSHDLVVPDAPLDREGLLEAVAEADALVCLLTVGVDEELLSRAERLRVVGNVAVGYDNVDVEAATRAGVLVCNTPGVLDETVADLAFGLMLSASRLMSEAERDLRAQQWPGWDIDQYLGHDVHGATLGLVGYGRIGRAMARRARGFDMNVLHHTRSDTGEDGWVGELDELLQRSDVVSLHVPLDDSTRHLIGPAQLERMRTTAVLVNTSRGPVVDEAALAEALREGRIFAAGLDVYEDEPEVPPDLLDAPRTVLTPHIGSASWDTRLGMIRLAAEAVAEALEGEVPDNAVNPEAWD